MKNYLYITNSTKPTTEQYKSLESIRLTNESIPCIEAAKPLGYEIYMGVNRLYAEKLESEYDIRFYNSSSYRSLFDFKSNFIAYKNLMDLLKKEKIEVIHCNSPIGGILGRICGRIAKTPIIIYTAHGFHFYKGAPLINRTIFKWAEMWMAHFTDAIITMNSEDYEAAKLFKLRENGKIYYIPGVGVDTQEFRSKDLDRRGVRDSLGLKTDDIVFISMGDLIQRKNYASSIKAIAKAGNEKLHFLVCGEGPLLDQLKKITQKLNLVRQIHFLGFRNDIKELLQIADIFLFTSYQEGLPRSMMEAMSAGLPCIASKIRGNIDLIENGKGGYLYEPDDINGFAEGIKSLISQESLRKQMGEHNLSRIKNFDITKIKYLMSGIYNEILKKNDACQ